MATRRLGVEEQRVATGRVDREEQRAEGGAAGGDLTIERLAAQTGMTVRNIRNHQSRGLLPPPEVRARVGYYGDEHVRRLRVIQEMQADGFNLEAIKRLVVGAPDAAERLLGIKQAALAPGAEETPEVLTGEELTARFGGASPKELAKAERLGLLVDLGGDRWEAPSPGLLRAAEEVMRHGVSMRAALQVVERMRRHLDAVARAFVRLFLEEVWQPFEDAGQPDERWPEVIGAIEALRPLAAQAVEGMLALTLSEQVESAFGKVLERQTKR